jgi:hypothetical protein
MSHRAQINQFWFPAAGSAELADAGWDAWHRCAGRLWSVPGVAVAGLGCLQAADEGVEACGEPFVAVV